MKRIIYVACDFLDITFYVNILGKHNLTSSFSCCLVYLRSGHDEWELYWFSAVFFVDFTDVDIGIVHGAPIVTLIGAGAIISCAKSGTFNCIFTLLLGLAEMKQPLVNNNIKIFKSLGSPSEDFHMLLFSRMKAFSFNISHNSRTVMSMALVRKFNIAFWYSSMSMPLL